LLALWMTSGEPVGVALHGERAQGNAAQRGECDRVVVVEYANPADARGLGQRLPTWVGHG